MALKPHVCKSMNANIKNEALERFNSKNIVLGAKAVEERGREAVH